MNTADVMQALLDVATGAVPDVERTYLAPGPQWAKDCRSIVVHPVAMRTVTPRATDVGRLPGGECMRVPTPLLGVTFVDDCYPTPTESGATVKLPTADEITAWTERYMADVEAIYRALLDAATDGTFGDCAGVSLDDGTFVGPQGAAAWVTFGLRVSLTEPIST
jgi:hypothetical protein